MINFAEHLAIQDRLNCVINPQWRTAGYAWSDAAMVEAVEAFDHLAWKWWKKGEDNMPQFRLELVDIWHFLLSEALVTLPNMFKGEHWPTDPVALCAGALNEALRQKERTATSGSLKEMLRIFISECAEGRFARGTFFRLCELADLSLVELDRMYRAKGVLNLFRQANGYKDGSYVKMWGEHEDNVFLDQLMKEAPHLTADQLMDKLSRIYHAVIASVAYHPPSGHAVGNYDADGRRFRWDGTYLYAYDLDTERLASVAECDRWEKVGQLVPASAEYRPAHGGHPDIAAKTWQVGNVSRTEYYK